MIYFQGSCDLNAIQIIKKLGGSLDDSFLDEGGVLKDILILKAAKIAHKHKHLNHCT